MWQLAPTAFTDFPGLQQRVLDFEQPATLAPALQGIDRLLLVRPPALSDVARYLRPVVEAARVAGVQHVVFLSLQGAQFNIFAPHHRVEGYLRDSGLYVSAAKLFHAKPELHASGRHSGLR